ncbi:FAD-binding oxidoreductase [Actinomadura spongiicola]|uniref:FAD-binding oxidoreductase n=1 Tax=Actinomadura spongiicola TaxID=2303421 RepID=UPI0011C132AB|nr:FAD-dependent oxidoreductase [Actinomadura spongiicola]
MLPGDPAYARAKQAHYAQYDVISPQAVAYCTSARDVSACLRFARDHGIVATARSGGHSTAGYSTSRGLIVDVSRIKGVRLQGRNAVLGAGDHLVDVTHGLAPHGLGFPGGLSPTVGVAGFLQGGGHGFLTRKEGMGCDHILAAEVVLADGEIVVAKPDHNAELLWALRGGGGGNFGIVTRFQVRPVVVSTLVNFDLTWTWEHAARALSAWQHWIAAAPRNLGSQLDVLLVDAAPGSAPMVSLSGVWSGDAAGAAAQLNELVAAVGAPPATRREKQMPYRDAMMEWYGCADHTVPQCHRSGSGKGVLPRDAFFLARARMYDAPQSASTVDTVLEAFDADRRAGHTRVLSALAFGGKVNTVSRTETAYVHRDTQYALVAATRLETGTPKKADRTAAQAWEDDMFRVLDPSSNGETYQNFVDPAMTDWRSAYYAENYARLVAIKKHYDPDRFFDFPQAIGA